MSSIESVTGVILAGGKSRRFGTNKALSIFQKEHLIERLVRSIRDVTHELVLVTNEPDEYAFLGLRMVGDIMPDCGSLGGIYTGLNAMTTSHGIFVACDMPFVRASFLTYILTFIDAHDVIVPLSNNGLEPLCAVYGKACISPIETNLQAGRLKIISFFDQVRVRTVTAEETPLFDPHMLFNVNTREDYEEALRLLKDEEVRR